MASSTSIEAIQQFLQSGQPIDQLNGDNKSLAQLCLETNASESLALLVRNGHQTKGLIHRAIELGSFQCFQSLTDLVDIDEADDSHVTPVFFSVRKQQTQFIRALCDKGADLSTALDDDITIPLTEAINENSAEIASILLDAHSPTSPISPSSTPLLTAASKGLTKLCFLLIQYAADPNISDPDAQAPLLIAIQSKNLPLIRLLLAAGASIAGIATETLEVEIQAIFNEYSSVPNPAGHDAVDNNLTSLIDEFQNVQKRIDDFISQGDKANFQVDFITPMVNLQHLILTYLIKYVRRLDQYGKEIFRVRENFLAGQFSIIAKAERENLSKAFEEDEAKWSSAIEQVKKLIPEGNKLFPADARFKIEKIGSEISSKKDDVFSSQIQSPQLSSAENRGHLLFLNRLLGMFKSIVRETYRIFIRFDIANESLYDKEIDTMKKLLESLTDVQRIEAEVGSGGKSDNETSAVCGNQSDRIRLDLSFVEWEKKSYKSISKNVLRCLRYCLQ